MFASMKRFVLVGAVAALIVGLFTGPAKGGTEGTPEIRS